MYFETLENRNLLTCAPYLEVTPTEVSIVDFDCIEGSNAVEIKAENIQMEVTPELDNMFPFTARNDPDWIVRATLEDIEIPNRFVAATLINPDNTGLVDAFTANYAFPDGNYIAFDVVVVEPVSDAVTLEVGPTGKLSFTETVAVTGFDFISLEGKLSSDDPPLLAHRLIDNPYHVADITLPDSEPAIFEPGESIGVFYDPENYNPDDLVVQVSGPDYTRYDVSVVLGEVKPITVELVQASTPRLYYEPIVLDVSSILSEQSQFVLRNGDQVITPVEVSHQMGQTILVFDEFIGSTATLETIGELYGDPTIDGQVVEQVFSEELEFVTPGDIDRDGDVEFVDFLVFARSYLNTSSAWSAGDFDGDGTNSFADFLLLSQYYGKG